MNHYPIVIIGAGISGLSAGFFLKKLNKDFIILESGNNVGGLIKSKTIQGATMEYGPNSILADETTMEIIDQLGISESIVEASPISKSRFIYANGKYHELSANPLSLLASSLLSSNSKWKLVKGLFKHPPDLDDNITIMSYFNTLLGEEATKKLVAPFVGGIYAGAIDKLLVKYTFASFVEKLKSAGSLINLIRTKGAFSRRKSLQFKHGLAEFTNVLGLHLADNIALKSPVTAIQREDKLYRLQLEEREITCDKLIFTAPSYVLPKLLNEDALHVLNDVYYPPIAMVHILVEKDYINALNGFGGLHTPDSNTFALGYIWNSMAYSARSDENHHQITAIVGGSTAPHKAQLPEKEIINIIITELKTLYQLKKEPIYTDCYFWKKGIPQYENYMPKVESLVKELQNRHIYICANWYGGVSLVDCINKGKNLAERI